MIDREDGALAGSGERRTLRKIKRRFLFGTAFAVALAIGGIVIRSLNAGRLEDWTRRQAVPTVKAVQPKTSAGQQELVLPGNIQAFYDARLRARVSGYVKNWKYDIGAHVKAGEIIATIDAPDLEQQLEQAKGEQARAESETQLAKVTSKRWSALRASTAVSQQSVDEKSGDYSAKQAQVAAARANVERLKALQGFTQITAPFAGVVTARNVDIGDLVGPDRTQELFAVADIHQVRVYVSVPQSYVAQLHEGMQAKLKLPQFPAKLFSAKLVTTSKAIAEQSRALLVQLLADNPEGMLLPGSFAEVHFILPGNPEILRIPADTILYRDNRLNVATVGPGDKVQVKPIEIARDLGAEIEVASGIAASDLIIENPSEMISDGDVVQLSADSATKRAPAPAGNH
jgi:RND family efflux transporter MFP subunit